MHKTHEEEYFTKEARHSAEIATILQTSTKKERLKITPKNPQRKEPSTINRQRSDNSPILKKKEENAGEQDHPSISRTPYIIKYTVKSNKKSRAITKQYRHPVSVHGNCTKVNMQCE